MNKILNEMSLKSYTVYELCINHYLPYPKAKKNPVSKKQTIMVLFVRDTYLEIKTGKDFYNKKLYKVNTFDNNLSNISLTMYIIYSYVNKENIQILDNLVRQYTVDVRIL